MIHYRVVVRSQMEASRARVIRFWGVRDVIYAGEKVGKRNGFNLATPRFDRGTSGL